MKYCPKCGTLCLDTDQFCRDCGGQLPLQSANTVSTISSDKLLVHPNPDHYKKKSTSVASFASGPTKQKGENSMQKQKQKKPKKQQQQNISRQTTQKNKISTSDVFVFIISIIAAILILLVVIFVSEAGIIPAGIIAASWAALVRTIKNN